ncbi:MAG: HAMP domain-containing histidine kinase [Cyclobacteriaceae bacterium]|nr:HAMP domain-containing histidine kinase [Cyclobacteriaceae bacterium]
MRFIGNLVYKGFDKNPQFEDQNDYVLINTISLSGLVFNTVLTFLSFLFFSWIFFLLSLTSIVVCIAVYLLNTNRQEHIARYIFALSIPIYMVLFTYFYGNIGMEYILIPAVIFAAYLLRSDSLGSTIIFIFGAIEFIFCKYLLIEHHEALLIPEEYGYLFYPTIVVSLSLIYAGTWLFRSSHLRRRKELTAISEVRGKLLSILSHDLRGPMNNLKMLSKDLTDETIPDNDKKYLLNLLFDDFQSTSMMLENTLLWVKRQMNDIHPDHQRINISKVVEENIHLLKSSADQKKVEVISRIPENLSVYSDKEILNLILRNLITNAIKFSYPNRGRVEVSAEMEGEKLWIKVKDNGLGMDENKLNSLFSDPTSNIGTNKEKGYGVGLILVSTFIQSLGERLRVKSEKNKGSEFLFSLDK